MGLILKEKEKTFNENCTKRISSCSVLAREEVDQAGDAVLIKDLKVALFLLERMKLGRLCG